MLKKKKKTRKLRMSPHNLKTAGNGKKKENVTIYLYLLFFCANWFLEIHTKNKRPYTLMEFVLQVIGS